jgi:hypothetical protein
VGRSVIAAIAVFVLVGFATVAVGLWLRAMAAPEWLLPDTTQHPPGVHPWMVEADCYSQLARVQRILHGDGLIQSHFKVENWPEGLIPSTTAPFDYVILLLYAPLQFFVSHPLDWAGALVSPFLWVCLVGFWMIFPSREFTRVGRTLFLIGSAALPGIIWATAFGRPRHQSLILLLLALGWTAEYERWHMAATPRRAWSIFAGIVWGLACWTSLFEPVFVVAIILLYNFFVRRRESLPLLISFGGVMLLALLLEGVHVFIPPPEYRDDLARWLGTIGEVRGFSATPELIGQLAIRTLSYLLLPLVAWILWSRENSNRTDRLLVVLTLFLTIFTVLQDRWNYYANLAELFLIVRFYQMAPKNWLRLSVLGIFLLGLVNIDHWKIRIASASGPAQPSLQLLKISRSIDDPGGILAPWWLSPGLLYFSGHPIVSGSSHCGISGIVASAEFYNATSWTEAEKILRQRQVKWIVVFDDPTLEYPVLNTSRGILGLPFYTYEDSADAASGTVAQTLITDQYVPTWLHLRGVTQQMKLYEYVPMPGS